MEAVKTLENFMAGKDVIDADELTVDDDKETTLQSSTGQTTTWTTTTTTGRSNWILHRKSKYSIYCLRDVVT